MRRHQLLCSASCRRLLASVQEPKAVEYLPLAFVRSPRAVDDSPLASVK